MYCPFKPFTLIDLCESCLFYAYYFHIFIWFWIFTIKIGTYNFWFSSMWKVCFTRDWHFLLKSPISSHLSSISKATADVGPHGFNVSFILNELSTSFLLTWRHWPPFHRVLTFENLPRWILSVFLWNLRKRRLSRLSVRHDLPKDQGAFLWKNKRVESSSISHVWKEISFLLVTGSKL